MTGDKPNHNRRSRMRVRDDRGAAAVEFAIVAPLLFLLVFAIIDFGFGFHAWDATQNAAREGARLAAVSSDQTAIHNRAVQTASFLPNTVTVPPLECAKVLPTGLNGPFGACGPSATWDEGDLVRVTVEYQYEYMTPLPAFAGMGTTLDMKSVAETRFEGN